MEQETKLYLPCKATRCVPIERYTRSAVEASTWKRNATYLRFEFQLGTTPYEVLFWVRQVCIQYLFRQRQRLAAQSAGECGKLVSAQDTPESEITPTYLDCTLASLSCRPW
jgi:hypothetical protein